jgi:hypothetical protein
VTLVEEGLAAMRGCWRLIWRDPRAEEDFNLTIDGFWRSYDMVLPILVLAYPMFLSNHKQDVAWALENDLAPPELDLGIKYFCMLLGIAVWPMAAALLAKLCGVTQNYVPYMIVYNWMTLPTMTLAINPNLLHLTTGATLPLHLLGIPAFVLLLYVSWYIAKSCLRTTATVAFAFLLADVALTIGLSTLIR